MDNDLGNELRNNEITLFLAGRSKTAGDRLHLMLLEMHLQHLGYRTHVPFHTEEHFTTDGKLNAEAFSDAAQTLLRRNDVILVDELEAQEPDVNSAVDYGIAMATGHRSIIYTTDGSTEDEAMLHLRNTSVIHFPRLTKETLETYYEELAERIDGVIRAIHAIDNRMVTGGDVEDTCP